MTSTAPVAGNTEVDPRYRVRAAAPFHSTRVCLHVLLAVACGVGMPPTLSAQGHCDRAAVTITAGGSADSLQPLSGDLTGLDIGALSGRRIAWVRVITLPPDPLPGAAAALDGLHVRTRPATVQRELLFASGDTVDSIRVSESLRRLRRLRYLADVRLVVSSADTLAAPLARNGGCTDIRRASVGSAVGVLDPGPAIGLTVTTRDAWSARPDLRIGGAGASGSVIGVEERNLMGTGRLAKAYLRTSNGRLGAGLAYVDPWLFGRDVVGSVSHDAFRDGSAWQVSARTHQRSIFDPWVADFTLAQSTRTPFRGTPAAMSDAVRRRAAQLLFDRLLTSSPFGATRLLFGVEGEQARETAPLTAPVVGPFSVDRSFLGVDAGLAHHTARYESNDWLLPTAHAAADAHATHPVDVPRGAEGEAVVAFGHDFFTRRPAIHLDGWGGKMWRPGERSLITADVWASGFRTGSEWSAASVRAALGAFRAANRGLWSAHVAAEELTDPDPTVRALGTFDPTIASLPTRSRLAEAALAGSLERALHLRPATRSYMLDVAAFGAGSLRWDPALTNRDQLGVVAIGAGLRLSPMRQGIATLRLDVGVPIMRSAGISSRPFVALSISPWLGSGRQRDGRQPQ